MLKVGGELAWWFERHDEMIFLFKTLGFQKLIDVKAIFERKEVAWEFVVLGFAQSWKKRTHNI